MGRVVVSIAFGEDCKMCVVVPHILPKGGSGAAPLLDTPAKMIRFTDPPGMRWHVAGRSRIIATYRRCTTRKGDFVLPCTP